MKTKAVRLYQTVFVCLLTRQEHKRVPNDIDVNPIIVGHEFAGEIV